VHPQKEDYWGNVNPIGPRACYDEGKRCAETLFFDYNRQHNLDIPLPQDDPKQRQPDITLAKSRLNWEPKVPIQEGLIKTI